MFHSVAVRAAVFFVAAFPFCHPAVAQEGFVDAYAGQIEAMLGDQFADSRGGIVIGLVDEYGTKVWSKGKLDNGTDGMVDGDTIFEIGSVTKVFTVLLLKDAVRRGEMRLQDPVSKYLPKEVSVPSRGGKEITLLNLACQDSGLPHFPDNQFEPPIKQPTLQQLKQGGDAYTVEKLYAFLSKYRLPQDPGAAFAYSNVGMALLGHAIERRTGGDYESLLLDRICRPLNLETTRITLTPSQRRRLARGHLVDGTPSEHIRFQAMAPAGSLVSTANDMLKFLSASLGLTQSRLTPLFEDMQVVRHSGDSQFGKTAMPWYDGGVYCPEGSEFLGHSGGGFGTIAFIAMDIKQRRGVVVLTNQMKVHPNPIGWTILQGLPLSRENITFAAREVVGIGVYLQADEKTGLPRIATFYPMSPAGKSGLRAGLLVEKINGASTANKELSECLRMLGGPVGATVELQLLDAETKTASILELQRSRFITARGEAIKPQASTTDGQG